MKNESKFLKHCRKCSKELTSETTYKYRLNTNSNICKLCNNKEVKKNRQNNMRNWLYAVMLRAKHSTKERNSRGKNQTFDINIDFLLKLLEKQQGKCSLTGIVLEHTHNNWKSASIDRINNKFGYTIDNVRLICYGANVAMARLTEQEFVELCKAVANQNSLNT